MPKKTTGRRPAAPVDGNCPRPDGERILERIMRELPARQGKRRIRWATGDLERIVELARDARARLTAAEQDEDPGEHVPDRLLETAGRLLAARRAPTRTAGATAVAQAQVAYLVPIEVVIDLHQQVVTKVVVIDEAIELDLEEGARVASTLEPLAPGVAQAAIRVAELEDGGEWPAMEFGW